MKYGGGRFGNDLQLFFPTNLSFTNANYAMLRERFLLRNNLGSQNSCSADNLWSKIVQR